jgi:NADPH-dependent 2,4-dienoyl-CoA reductase/sulfur reductase-like enzyme
MKRVVWNSAIKVLDSSLASSGEGQDRRRGRSLPNVKALLFTQVIDRLTSPRSRPDEQRTEVPVAQSTTAGVVVVGASAAGLSLIQSLRRIGYDRPITMVGAERHLPYDRPPLSKQVLEGKASPEAAQLFTYEALAALQVETVLGQPAIALDPDRRIAETAIAAFTADNIVIATGATPRRLSQFGDLRGVHVLRTIDDVVALRADLLQARRVVIVGDGVLGAEVAATATRLGVSVTLVGEQAAPMTAQLGPFAAELLAELHSENGVALRPGAKVTALVGVSGMVAAVELDYGEELPADVVVVAIGVTPATEWLANSGLQIDDGVVCDQHCSAAPGIYAVGDVCRWRHPVRDRLIRLENRTNATEQAAAVAATIMGELTPYAPVPYFWTDQYGARIQVHGSWLPDNTAEVVEGTFDSRRFVLAWRHGNTVTGLLGWNMPKQTRLLRQQFL